MAALACIAVTKPDWALFHKLTHQIFNKYMISELDARKISCDTPLGFIAALSQMEPLHKNPINVIRNLDRIGKHASATFLFQGHEDTATIILLHTDLQVSETENEGVYILSGNLEQWQKAVISLAQTGILPSFATIAVEEFDRLGMGQMFEEYSRKVTHLGLILVKK